MYEAVGLVQVYLKKKKLNKGAFSSIGFSCIRFLTFGDNLALPDPVRIRISGGGFRIRIRGVEPKKNK